MVRPDFLCGFSIEMSSLGTDKDVSVGGPAAEVAVMRCNAVWKASARHFSRCPTLSHGIGTVARGPTAGTCSQKKNQRRSLRSPRGLAGPPNPPPTDPAFKLFRAGVGAKGLISGTVSLFLWGCVG